MGKHIGLVAGVVLAAMALTALPVGADPVVVELFTSQGCSSCPPANANLAAIANRSDILALSFGVTYWDQLGWKDTFAQDKFTQRQVAYARALGHSGPFTPQIVVNGVSDGTGIARADLETLISRAPRPAGPVLNLRDGQVKIAATPEPAALSDVWLVYFDPRTVNVPIQAGENNGATLPHRNVVKELRRLGSWRGGALSLALPPAPAGLSRAILVQRINGGPILAAEKG
jgi:hypothetical protein